MDIARCRSAVDGHLPRSGNIRLYRDRTRPLHSPTDQQTFPYLVSAAAATGGGDLPDLRWHIIEHSVPLRLFGVEILPIPVEHGAYFAAGQVGKPFLCLSFLFDRSLLYMSDVSSVPADALALLAERVPSGTLSVLVVDCLRIGRHASHFGVGQAIALARTLRPTRTYLTGCAHACSPLR